MVDPNRKINRLVERDLNFLESCELEFADRFTDDDPEFMAHCSKPVPEPPIVENWMGGGGGGGGFQGGGGGGHPYHNRYNGHRRGGGDRGWQRRGGAGYHNNQDRGFRGNTREEAQFLFIAYQRICSHRQPAQQQIRSHRSPESVRRRRRVWRIWRLQALP